MGVEYQPPFLFAKRPDINVLIVLLNQHVVFSECLPASLYTQLSLPISNKQTDPTECIQLTIVNPLLHLSFYSTSCQALPYLPLYRDLPSITFLYTKIALSTSMLPLATLQLFPASLLLFLATAPIVTQSLNNPWPFRLGHFSRSNHAKRDGTATDYMDRIPIAVRKMSGNQGEMFFPEYWRFELETSGAIKLELDRRRPTLRSLGPLEDESVVQDWANASIPQPLQAPFSLHTNRQLDTLFSRLFRHPEAIFARDARDFACPSGTSACTSINRPYSCCATGLVCQLTADSGLGDVGCCNPGQVCGQEVSGCPDQDSSCPDSLGGGCCIPGSVCDGVGCELDIRFPSQTVHSLIFGLQRRRWNYGDCNGSAYCNRISHKLLSIVYAHFINYSQ